MEKLVIIKKVQDIDVLTFSFNEITLEQREQLKKELRDLSRMREDRFIIDLSKVGFLSSLVIVAIMSFAKDVWGRNGEIKLSGLSSEMFSIFQLTRLDKIFELYDTVDKALESFKSHT